MNDIPLYHIELVRDRSIPLTKLSRTEQCAEVFHQLLDKSPVEQMAVIHLDASDKLVGVEKVGYGSLTQVTVSMANIFRGALLASVPFIVLGHNHPSDDPTPSHQDWDLTDAAKRLGAELGIHVLDHIVVAQSGAHVSMKNEDASQQQLLGSLMNIVDLMPPDMKREMEENIRQRGLDPNSLPRSKGPLPLPMLDPIDLLISPTRGDKLLPFFNKKR